MGEPMRTCEAIFGRVQADDIEALIAEATGQPCPCRRALSCPLVDDEGCTPLVEFIPSQSRAGSSS